jgi:hypothetical protein
MVHLFQVSHYRVYMSARLSVQSSELGLPTPLTHKRVLPATFGSKAETHSHCKENPIYVFLFWELRGPNFHIHVSESDLYIPRISPQISL